MSEQLTKSRQTAEIAFAKTQSQFLARSRAVDEQDAIASARDEKTSRLREARLTREREARESATAAWLPSAPAPDPSSKRSEPQ